MARRVRPTPVTVFGVLSLAFGVLALILLAGLTLVGFVFGGGLGGQGFFGVNAFGAAVATIALVVAGPMAVLGIATGIGVLKLRGWGRVLGLVTSVLALIQVPVGTAYGVFGLWLLTREETKRVFSS